MSTNGWGKGSVNNTNSWGAGAINNDIGWGDSQLRSWSGDTDIDGGTGIPVNTVAPVISGTTTLGSVLTTTNGTWTAKPSATFTYQWKRNGSNIIGATNSTYTLVVADSAANITCEVTATNDFGSASAISNTITAQTFQAPVNTVAPAISGTAQENQTLTCSTGTWTGTPTITYAYQWKRNNVNIIGAINSTYTLVSADVAQSIKCTVTATNSVGNTNADSNTVTPTSAVDSDAQAFITAAAITNPTQQTAINQLVTDLKGYGIWSKMKALYPFVGGTASSHSYNLKNTSQFQITWNGGVTHSSTGVTGNGTNGYGNTGLNDSTILNIDNKHISMYQRNILSEPSGSSMGIANSNRFYLNSGGQNYSTLGMNQSPFAIQTPQRGMFVMSKTANGSFKYFQNALTPVTKTGTNSAQNLNYFVGACNNGGTGFDYTSANLAFVSIGDGLTDTEAANFYTAVQTFQVTLGRSIGTQTVSDADAQAFVTNAGIVDQVEADAVNNLVIGLKADGLWSKMKAVYPFVGGTASTHKFNLKDPRDLDAAFRLVFNGGWTHSANGALPNGTNGFADTKLSPNIEMPFNQQIGYYLGTNAIGNKVDVGVYPEMNLWTKHASLGFILDFPTSADRATIINSDSRGNYFVFNNSTLGRGLYKGGSSIHSSTFLNKNLADNNTRFLRLSSDAFGFYFSDRQLRFAALATGFNSLTEVTNFQTAIQAFQTALNRQV